MKQSGCIMEIRKGSMMVMTSDCLFKEIKKQDNAEVGMEVEFLQSDIIKRKNNRYMSYIAAAAAFMLVVISSIFFFKGWDNTIQPVAILTIDINPSIELKLDKNNTVIAAEALNSDADELPLSELISKSPLDALNIIVDAATNKGYITESDVNFILITSVALTADATDYVDELMVELKDKVQASNSSNKSIVVYTMKSDKETLEKARTEGVSVGRVEIMKQIQEKKSDIDYKEANSRKVNELVNEVIVKKAEKEAAKELKEQEKTIEKESKEENKASKDSKDVKQDEKKEIKNEVKQKTEDKKEDKKENKIEDKRDQKIDKDDLKEDKGSNKGKESGDVNQVKEDKRQGDASQIIRGNQGNNQHSTIASKEKQINSGLINIMEYVESKTKNQSSNNMVVGLNHVKKDLLNQSSNLLIGYNPNVIKITNKLLYISKIEEKGTSIVNNNQSKNSNNNSSSNSNNSSNNSSDNNSSSNSNNNSNNNSSNNSNSSSNSSANNSTNNNSNNNSSNNSNNSTNNNSNNSENNNSSNSSENSSKSNSSNNANNNSNNNSNNSSNSNSSISTEENTKGNKK